MDNYNYQVLIQPLITEKTMDSASKGRYGFKVNIKSDKKQIVKEIENTFKVNVISIRTVIVKGKTKRHARRQTTKRLSNWKKAIVQLKPDQKIDLFETMQG